MAGFISATNNLKNKCVTIFTKSYNINNVTLADNKEAEEKNIFCLDFVLMPIENSQFKMKQILTV